MKPIEQDEGHGADQETVDGLWATIDSLREEKQKIIEDSRREEEETMNEAFKFMLEADKLRYKNFQLKNELLDLAINMRYLNLFSYVAFALSVCVAILVAMLIL